MLASEIQGRYDQTHSQQAWIVYPGAEAYRVHERVEVVPLAAMLRRLQRLGSVGK